MSESQAESLMMDFRPNSGVGSGPGGIGIAADLRPHAYDPAANPELFEGVLARRVVAFVIDLTVIVLPLSSFSVSSPSALAGRCSGCCRRRR
jgi:hypothetical protein